MASRERPSPWDLFLLLGLFSGLGHHGVPVKHPSEAVSFFYFFYGSWPTRQAVLQDLDALTFPPLDSARSFLPKQVRQPDARANAWGTSIKSCFPSDKFAPYRGPMDAPLARKPGRLSLRPTLFFFRFFTPPAKHNEKSFFAGLVSSPGRFLWAGTGPCPPLSTRSVFTFFLPEPRSPSQGPTIPVAILFSRLSSILRAEPLIPPRCCAPPLPLELLLPCCWRDLF